jgi:hypothetical protein
LSRKEVPIKCTGKIDENGFGCQGTKVIELVCLVGAGRREPSIFGVSVVEPSRSMEREELFEGPLRFAPGNRVAGFFWLNEGFILALGLFPYLHKILCSRNVLEQIARTRRVPDYCAFSVFGVIGDT